MNSDLCDSAFVFSLLLGDLEREDLITPLKGENGIRLLRRFARLKMLRLASAGGYTQVKRTGIVATVLVAISLSSLLGCGNPAIGKLQTLNLNIAGSSGDSAMSKVRAGPFN